MALALLNVATWAGRLREHKLEMCDNVCLPKKRNVELHFASIVYKGIDLHLN